MPRATKCRSCLVIDKSEKVKSDNMYFHEGDCLEKYKKHKVFLEREKEEKNELYEYILKTHNISKHVEIPTLFYIKIEEVRNDSKLLGRVHKKYKEGVPYGAILYTYEYCKRKIDDCIINMRFETKLNELNYCLSIVKNNLIDAFNHKLTIMRAMKNNNSDQIYEDKSLVISEPLKRKKDELDISDLL